MTDDITSILLLHSHADTCRYIERAIARCGSGIKIDCPDQVTEVDVTQCRQQLIVGWDQFKVADDTTLLHLFRTQSVPVPVIFISSDGNSKNAVEAIRAGASDFLVQDSDEDLIIEAVRHALNQHSPATQPVDTFDETGAERKMVSCSSEMQQVIQLADRVAPSDATILIRGESGTGKELLSRYIHEHSGRTKGRLVAMNCAALPEQLVESELFGYEKGAFTGAAGKRQGRFEQAHQGTLMLDEISEMPILLQAKLLRVLQEKEIDRIGGAQPVPVDVRVIATTNRDLQEMVRTGDFREDLYYRLRVVPLRLPPLRERPEDIPLLAQLFIQKHGSANGRGSAEFSRQAMEMLCAYHWPGNVRELENTVMRSLLISPNPLIEPQDLLLDQGSPSRAKAKEQSLVGRTVHDVEKELIRQTLAHVNQNRTHAAKMLGISIRTLRNKLNAYKASQESPADRVAQG